ncbi:large subunit ribosomal protein L30 [Abyssogena phaseoliformis symbiont OG214]|uniref:50S ribosomal protein L30 n=1 Tax=Abyssogena phaseoliformis symbiont TaxID=596095 RepID=UPI0019165C35|nr:50S ribosomal protein L30 [Abyssogena phaseoliformis symbiont]MBW5289635.1 LSU ribosomal protein L30p (L7e) [Candidatus Ruthia sp. Apha_13_S6]BBB23132.1 large subunit ribosomal protein L30 [Abyssogena phaseoliformis symbiont OG214]
MAEENKAVKKVAATKKPTAKKAKAPVKAVPKKVAVAKKLTTIKKTQTSSKHNTVSVTLVKSFNGRLPSHRATIAGLGLKRINHIKELEDTPEIRGMINKVAYLLKVED